MTLLRDEPAPRRDGGFSLVEVLTVVAIIGLLSAVSMPAIMSYLRFFQIRAGAAQVASELQQARAIAIKRNANFGMVFFIRSPTQYQIYAEDVPGSATQGTRQDFTTSQAAGLAGPIRVLPQGIEFAASGNARAVRFDRLGMKCNVGGTGCAAVQGSLPGSGSYFSNSASELVITLRKATQTSLTKTVSISPGGRVVAQN
jgi:prepilin-type N-terminal cleavage/methylation domain-containing protein